MNNDLRQTPFFVAEVQNQIHYIIGILPLQAQLPFTTNIGRESTWCPFDEEVEYFMVKGKARKQKMNLICEKASLCAGRQIKEVSGKVQCQQCKQICFISQIDKQNALITVYSFQIQGQKMRQLGKQNQTLNFCERQQIKELFSFSKQIQFTNQSISTVFTTNSQIIIIYRVNDLDLFFEVETGNKKVQGKQLYQSIQISLIEYILSFKNIVNKQRISFNLYNISFQLYFSQLGWKERVIVTYQCMKLLSLVLHKNQLMKYKLNIYIFSICNLITQILESQVTLDSSATTIFKKIVEEPNFNVIQSLFQDLYHYLTK